jgi:hypothetical protein
LNPRYQIVHMPVWLIQLLLRDRLAPYTLERFERAIGQYLNREQLVAVPPLKFDASIRRNDHSRRGWNIRAQNLYYLNSGLLSLRAWLFYPPSVA